MLTFYLIAGGLALVAAIVIVRPLIAGRGEADSRDARDATVFRDQLAEVERDLARGTITPDEAEGARVEVSRRLIAADQRARHRGATGQAPQGRSGLVAGLALVGTPALAAALYLGLGEPGVPDQPLASRPAALAGAGGVVAPRPDQAEAEAAMAGQQQPPSEPDPEYAAMAKQLEATLADRPNDVQGHKLLANTLMNLGRYAEAWRTYDKVIELSGGTVDADTRGAKAEGMILAAGGYVSPEAEAEIARALQLDPSLPIARYYGGLALGQAGRLDEAIAMWQALRRDSPPDAPYLPWLDRMMADAMQARGGAGGGTGGAGGAGAAIPGPSTEDIAAAEQLTPEQRAEMVNGMVARLDDRLTRQGGTAQEWVQLIASYATLGRAEEARDAYDRALAALDGAGAETVRAQAARLGVADPAAAGPTTTLPDPAAPQSPAAPTEADIAAASGMSPEDRAAMVDGMVARLDDRLTRQGGTAEEWGRLMASYAKLGRMEAAADAYARALVKLGEGAGADAVRAHAARLGIASGAPAPAAPQTSRPTSPGPSAADMAAAAQMSPEDRAAMVGGMVARLEARLTGEGGSAEDWLRLIDSYMKLDQPQEAARAYRLAAEALQGDLQAAFVKEQALLMGVPLE